MPSFEYKVIPAPRRTSKLQGAKTTEDRFALTLTAALNDLGREGWEYQGSETLPCEERSGLTGTKTTTQIVMVFRRAVDASGAALGDAAASAPPRLGPATAAPVGAAPAVGPAAAD